MNRWLPVCMFLWMACLLVACDATDGDKINIPRETDSDDDAPETRDRCPDDPNKTEPGICDCGVPDDDSDGDGIEDCYDECHLDANKMLPGVCGCGIPDDDRDSDGDPDCLDTDNGTDRDADSDSDTADSDTDPDTGPIDVFSSDAEALAIFELNGDVHDSSGNGRDAELVGGTFVDTEFGQGLSVHGDPQGFRWTYSSLLSHPYTIEMVLVPEGVYEFAKLFGANDNDDNGWYYYENGFRAFPNARIGSGFVAHTRHYLAIVSTSASNAEVFLNGKSIGNTGTSFNAPPGGAFFFRDDTDTGRTEFLTGVIEAVRLSSVCRAAEEIIAVQSRLDSQPHGG